MTVKRTPDPAVQRQQTAARVLSEVLIPCSCRHEEVLDRLGYG
jgi:hypothetical protein